MKKKLLVDVAKKQRKIKEIAIFEDPGRMKLLLHKLTWRILEMLSKKEMYPLQISKELKVHEQKIYYHIRKLNKANAIIKVREEEKKGAIAKYYKTCFPAFGVELPFGSQKLDASIPHSFSMKVTQFLNPILQDGLFNGKIVVGSPVPHGPFKTSARDGHYASYLAFFLGQLSKLPDEFIVKLDVDVKAEKEEKNNLILVGGPGTNLITQEINEYLPVRFSMTESEQGFLLGGLVSQKTKKVYTASSAGIIAKVPNPWDREKTILIFAGNKAVGTKACVLALAKSWRQVLKNFKEEEDFAAVIQGFDLDGDGKVDSVEILE